MRLRLIRPPRNRIPRTAKRRGGASDTRRNGLNYNRDITDIAGQALGQREGKPPETRKKCVVGGIFLLLAVLLLAAIFALKNA